MDSRHDDEWTELNWLALKVTYRPPAIAGRMSDTQLLEPLGEVARRIEASAQGDRGGSALDQMLEHLTHQLAHVQSSCGESPELVACTVLSRTADLKVFQVVLVWLSKRVDGTRAIREYLL
jgi:hypothetical protein